MNRITALVSCALIVVALLFIGHGTSAQATASASNACGTITSDMTWTAISGPYKVCIFGVTVGPTATLTIEPGVTVQFEGGAGNKLDVMGALSAIGTVTQPITFTGVITTPGSWAGLSADNVVSTPALVRLSYVTLDYGGVNGSYGAQIYADRAVITITHSLIRNGGGNGLYTTSNTRFDVHTTRFIGNGRSAIQVNAPTTDLLMSDLSASGNGTNGVRIAATTVVPGQRRWAYPGIPYIVEAPIGNQAGGVWTIDPGNELQFTPNGWLNIGGQLKALGLPGQPITLTAQTQTPGGWRGVLVYGGAHRAIAQLDYVTVEYGGSDIHGANIEVGEGQLAAHHSIIRYSSKDGVRLDSNASITVLNSQIVSNTLYGVYNLQPASAILATNNWWGDPNGPKSDLSACSSGHGDKVTAGVLFRPVLTSTNLNAEFPLSDAPMLTLTPRRWFAPADGVTRVYFDITLRDGNGAPLPGRTVHLHTNLGASTDSGTTDANGHTLAWLTSNSTGEADVSATLDSISSCEGAQPPTAQVTFTPLLNITDLFPNAPAPYLDNDIQVTPLPVMTGISTTIRAQLINPLAVPITVDVSFEFAQAGIGLAFGPIKQIQGQVIPANDSVTLAASWTPSVSGHYCVQVNYDIVAVGSQRLARAQQGSSGSKQRNLNVYQGPTGSSGKDNSLAKTRQSLSAVNKFVDRTYDTGSIAIPLAVANKGIEWDLNNAEKIANALQGDPPRQDYQQIDAPHKVLLPPLQPGNGISAARAAAINKLDDALADMNAYGTAATLAFDRYGGASEAHDLQWASVQSAALLEYNQMMGQATITAAMRIDDVINVAASEGVTSVVISVADVISTQQKLAAAGFSAEEVADARALGLSDADIEAIRQSIITTAPQDLAGDVIVKMQQVRDQFFLLGGLLTNPAAFAPGLSVGGGAGFQSLTTGGNTLAQIYNTVATVQLGNPFSQTAMLDVRARRIDLPPDWAVDVSPAQISLAPGERTTVTVSVLTGSPVQQGSVPRLAVEGYAGNQLLGGIAIDIVVPNHVFFDGKLHVYLPLVEK